MNTLHPLYCEELDAVLNDLPSPEALRGASVLITGATGLIGAALTDTLAAADRKFGLKMRLYALSRNADNARARFAHLPCVVAVAGDVTLPLSGLPAADYIIHAASNAHPMAFSTDPVGTMKANILGTMHLLEHLRITGGRRLLLASTGEIYGENPEIEDGFTEDSFGKIDSMNPRSCYPESKRAAETLCASYIRQYGLDAVAARLCYVYGPGITAANSRADAQFLRKALAGEDIVMKSQGTQVRSYCYAPDAVSALLTLLLKGENGCAYNVAAPDGAHSIREYAETLARCAGVRVTFDLPPETEKQGYSAVTRAVLNASRLRALGWKPRYSLNEGLSRTFNILKSEV